MAAHELRTPLSVILGYGSLLAQGGLSPEHQKLAGTRSYEKARQLSRLIMDMSLVGRFDELGPAMAREPIDLVGSRSPWSRISSGAWRPGDRIQLRRSRAMVEGNTYWLHLRSANCWTTPSGSAPAHRANRRQPDRGCAHLAHQCSGRRVRDRTADSGSALQALRSN